MHGLSVAWLFLCKKTCFILVTNSHGSFKCRDCKPTLSQKKYVTLAFMSGVLIHILRLLGHCPTPRHSALNPFPVLVCVSILCLLWHRSDSNSKWADPVTVVTRSAKFSALSFPSKIPFGLEVPLHHFCSVFGELEAPSIVLEYELQSRSLWIYFNILVVV